MAFLNETGLATFLAYVKAWARAMFASKTDTQTIEGATTFSQTIVGNLSGNCSGSSGSCTGNAATATTASACTGNAATATKLATARTINGVAFDGSANITVADSTKLPLSGGQLTGNCSIKVSNVTRGTSTTYVERMLHDIKDSNGSRIGLFSTEYKADKSSFNGIWAYNTTVATGANIGSLGIGCDSSGVVYTKAPTPPTNDNSTQIATTAFVKAVMASLSDERKKTSITPVPDDVLDAWEAVGWGQFQFLEAIEAKGDGARLHLGLIAQRVKSVFEACGLDACGYGILCYDAEQDLWTVRYAEALAMEAVCQRRRADRLEARIAALEEAVR